MAAGSVRLQPHAGLIAVRELDPGILEHITYERFLIHRDGRLALNALGPANDS